MEIKEAILTIANYSVDVDGVPGYVAQALAMAISALNEKAERSNPQPLELKVIDPKTKEYPDLYKIALHEKWAKGLMYCDMEGFALEEDGTLLLLDECGNFAYCPKGRFECSFEPPKEVQP